MLVGRRGATVSMVAALAAVLLLFVLLTAAAGVRAVAADAEGTATSSVHYYHGDSFQDPKAPRFRPWRIFNFNVSRDGVLAFNCAGDDPTLRLLPLSDDHAEHGVNNSSNGTLPAETCGGGTRAGMTPIQYEFSRRNTGGPEYSALFWAGRRGVEEQEGRALLMMPVPRLQVNAILKLVAAVMEAVWREEKGEAMPEPVPFPADTVAFYINEPGVLVVMGREDVEFGKPWERLDGKIKALTLGAIV